MAAAKGFKKTCEVLLDYAKGLDVNQRTDRGETALHLAAKIAHSATMRMLVRAGADVNL
jgi:hypothetical protein